jgi:hypothetical protein
MAIAMLLILCAAQVNEWIEDCSFFSVIHFYRFQICPSHVIFPMKKIKDENFQLKNYLKTQRKELTVLNEISGNEITLRNQIEQVKNRNSELLRKTKLVTEFEDCSFFSVIHFYRFQICPSHVIFPREVLICFFHTCVLFFLAFPSSLLLLTSLLLCSIISD